MSQLRPHILSETAIAAHASSARPAWLFSGDGARVLFANAAGAALLAPASGPAVPAHLAAQLARSASMLEPGGQARLVLLRGLGTPLGRPLTCRCSLVPHHDDRAAILVAAIEAAGPRLTLGERAHHLIEGNGAAAAFTADGTLLHATPAAAHHISSTASLSDLGDGVETLPVGEGADAIVLAFFSDQPRPAEPAPAPPAQPELLDLSPIAEAITAMSKVPPQRNALPELPLEVVPETAQDAPVTRTAAPSVQDEAAPRRHPLRFSWETDAENRFTINSAEFRAIAGPRTANLLGRFWGEISAKLALDPEGLVANAVVSRNTWSGITVNWPTADGTTIPVTLSGIPAFDTDGLFLGYRGLGVCGGAAEADVDPLAGDETAVRQSEAARVQAIEPAPPAAPDAFTQDHAPIQTTQTAPYIAAQADDQGLNAFEAATPAEDAETDLGLHLAEKTAHEKPAQTENVVPFPTAFFEPKAEPKTGGLNAAERSAFRDLGSRLSARLRGADELARGLIEKPEPDDEPPYIPPPLVAAPQSRPDTQSQAVPDISAEPEEEAEGERPVLAKLPLGVLIYRGASLLYANPAFLGFAGYRSLPELAAAGGLDAMEVEFDDAADDDGGQRLRIAPTEGKPARKGHLVSVSFGGQRARMLMIEPGVPARQPAADRAAELAALLDIAADGIVTIDNDSMIVGANAPAEMLFGYGTGALVGRRFGDLFAPESERVAQSRLDRFAGSDVMADNDSREIIGRRRAGGLVPLHMTLARGDRERPRYHALFRDLTRWKDAEKEMTLARQKAESASAAKSEFLARISHEMRTPLNAILGFSEVMMEERFGPIGNDRYRDYLKDVHTSGGHLVSLLNDLLDLSKIEAGKMELSFQRVDLNEVTHQSVAIMQAQASRARVIVRTALSMSIPEITADARSVRQIVLNLLSNSIKFTGAGGQIIVSTAANDRGDVMLRVRDTGIGMSEKDIEAALQPFRQLTTSPRTDASGTGLGLPLTKALVEANRARFSIKSAVNAGTLVEIAFPAGRVIAE